MRQTTPYLIFPGTCREALAFYADCFQGKVTSMTTFADSPMQVAQEFETLIFDSEVRADGLRIRASDSLPEYPVRAGTNFALFVSFSEVEALNQVHAALLDGGQAVMLPDDTSEGAAFAMVSDRFGVQWMLSHQP